MLQEHHNPAYQSATSAARATTRRQAPGRLSLAQALAAAPYAGQEAARITIRDAILIGLRNLSPRQTPAADARRLANELRMPDQSSVYGEYLRTVRTLSRGRKALSADRIEKVFNRSSAGL